MYRIEKVMSGDTELLPDIVDTPIWNEHDIFNNSKVSKRIQLLAALYKAIEQRENYYQLNSPTTFGDPQYRYYCGVVVGFLQGMELEEIVENEKIVIKGNNRKIMVIDKVNRPKSYHDSLKEINDTLNELGMWGELWVQLKYQKVYMNTKDIE